MKSALVMGATQGQISVEKMSNVTDCMENVLQIAQLWLKAFERIQQIESSITTLNENQNEHSDAALAD